MSDINYDDWRKASFSNGQGACVETASAVGTVAVRDTTDREGGTLLFSADAWAKFMASLK
jgi:Domain of unknown function (DUF397)